MKGKKEWTFSKSLKNILNPKMNSDKPAGSGARTLLGSNQQPVVIVAHRFAAWTNDQLSTKRHVRFCNPCEFQKATKTSSTGYK